MLKKEVYDKISEIIKFLECHWVILTFCITGVATLIVGLFKGGAYLYTKAYYDFWGIPLDYINVDFTNTLYKFLISIFLSILLIIISSIYYIIFSKIKHGEKAKLHIFFWVSSVFIMVTLGLLLYLIFQFPFLEIVRSVTQHPKSFLGNIIAVSIMMFGCIIFCSVFWNVILEIPFTRNNSQNNNEDKKSINIRGVLRLMIIIILAITITICVEGRILYNSRLDSINETTELNIAQIDNKEYIVISQYKDSWILKECSSKGDDFQISKTNYMFYNLEGVTVVKKELESDRKIDSYFTEENLSQD